MNKFYAFLIVIIFNSHLIAQVAINSDGSAPEPSAMLDIKSTSKGLLIPRMTATERDNITSPATGLLVFVTDDNAFWYYDGTQWTHAGADNLGNHKAERNLEMLGHWISNDGDNEGLYIYDNGWVALNYNLSPALATFHIKGDDTDIMLNMNSSSTTANLIELRYALDDEIKTNLYFDKRDGIFYFKHDVQNEGLGPIVFNHGNNENVLVITPNGRIGVGTQTPDRLVQGISTNHNASLQMETTDPNRYASVEARSNIGNIAALSHGTGRPGPSRWGLSTVAGYYELVGAKFNSPPEDPLGMIIGNRENSPLFFGTNNIFRMVIKEDGKVGINEMNPVTQLDVNGIIRHGKSLRFYSANSSNGREWVRFTDASNTWGDNIYISAGAVTTVGSGESSVTVRNNINNDDGHETLYLTSDARNNSLAIRFITSLQNGWNGRVEAMTIQGDGDIGIGTATPTAKLHVNGGDNSFAWGGDHSDSGYIRIGNLQIVWGRIYLEGTSWKSGHTIDFPAAFIDQPVVTATARRPDGTTYTTAFQIKEETTTGFTVWQSIGLEAEDSMTSLFINWIAIGRWQ